MKPAIVRAVKEKEEYMIFTIYQLIWLFLIYAFLGWCCEIAFCGIQEGHFVNRGFLNGPWCPIYGVGGVLIVLCLKPAENSVVLLFIGALVICSAIELLTGWGLEKIYHARWWDYSDKKLNIGGYICLEFSLLWGFFGIFLMKLLHPFVFMLVSHLSNLAGYISFFFLCAVFIADLALTILTVRNMTNRIRHADELSEKIKDASEKIARNVYFGAVKIDSIGKEIRGKEDVREFIEKTQTAGRVMQRRTDWQIAEFRAAHEDELEELAEKLSALKEKYAELRGEHDDDERSQKELLKELKESYEKTVDKKNILQERIMNAFPNLKFKEHSESYKRIKKRRDERKNCKIKK